MSSFENVEGAGYEGESLDASGVTLVVGRREEAAVAASSAELLKTDDAELLCELADPTVLIKSAGDDSLSST